MEVAHPLGRSIFRGLRHRCPNCGDGRLFGRYLKVNAQCPACEHDLSHYKADDGPAYLTILVVGHLVVAPLLLFPIVWEASPFYTVPITLVALTVITLAALPRIKGGWVGLMYALGMTDRHARLHTADAAD